VVGGGALPGTGSCASAFPHTSHFFLLACGGADVRSATTVTDNDDDAYMRARPALCSGDASGAEGREDLVLGPRPGDREDGVAPRPIADAGGQMQRAHADSAPDRLRRPEMMFSPGGSRKKI
jgi:hypothetical protein